MVIEPNQIVNFKYPHESVSLRGFKSTPVYLYKKETDDGATLICKWRFQCRGKTILSFNSKDNDRALYDIHTTNNGKNLVLSYIDESIKPYEVITDTYDISNPSVAKLIKRQINRVA